MCNRYQWKIKAGTEKMCRAHKRKEFKLSSINVAFWEMSRRSRSNVRTRNGAAHFKHRLSIVFKDKDPRNNWVLQTAMVNFLSHLRLRDAQMAGKTLFWGLSVRVSQER